MTFMANTRIPFIRLCYMLEFLPFKHYSTKGIVKKFPSTNHQWDREWASADRSRMISSLRYNSVIEFRINDCSIWWYCLVVLTMYWNSSFEIRTSHSFIVYIQQCHLLLLVGLRWKAQRGGSWYKYNARKFRYREQQPHGYLTGSAWRRSSDKSFRILYRIP